MPTQSHIRAAYMLSVAHVHSWTLDGYFQMLGLYSSKASFLSLLVHTIFFPSADVAVELSGAAAHPAVRWFTCQNCFYNHTCLNKVFSSIIMIIYPQFTSFFRAHWKQNSEKNIKLFKLVKFRTSI